ncbi:MAG: hypothetical protein M1826_002218 [Phylliscum demangeonii]|nr:MAG: hypothetical protein M1826_002218 [Phylliscum demangeonii]
MECASRAIAFWTYQTTQEIVYQEFLARKLQGNFDDARSNMEKIVRDAGSEIGDLQKKLSALQLKQDELQTKNHELAEALKEKTRKHNQMRELYSKAKNQVLLAQVQHSALDAIGRSTQHNDLGMGDAVSDITPIVPHDHRARVPMSFERQYPHPQAMGERHFFDQLGRPERTADHFHEDVLGGMRSTFRPRAETSWGAGTGSHGLRMARSFDGAKKINF